jgi:hypothetical protein
LKKLEEKNRAFLCSDLGKSLKYIKTTKETLKKSALLREDGKQRPEKTYKF